MSHPKFAERTAFHARSSQELETGQRTAGAQRTIAARHYSGCVRPLYWSPVAVVRYFRGGGGGGRGLVPRRGGSRRRRLPCRTVSGVATSPSDVHWRFINDQCLCYRHSLDSGPLPPEYQDMDGGYGVKQSRFNQRPGGYGWKVGRRA